MPYIASYISLFRLDIKLKYTNLNLIDIRILKLYINRHCLYFYQISIDSQKIKTLKNNLSLNERIIRYLFIKVNEHDKLPTKILKGNE